MEITSITHFAVDKVETRGPRNDCITKIMLSIESRTSGKHSLILIEPFPPFGRAGKRLAKLESLQRERIESIWAFPVSDEGRSSEDARIEITTTAGERAILHCREIGGASDCVD